MIFYIAAYTFVAIATTIVVYDPNGFPVRNELIASMFTGAMWPLIFAVRIISKLIK
jgi:hypothetical protein